MKAVIYSRISPRKDLDESDSIELQEEVCRSFCEGQGIEVKAAFADEGISGGNVERPGLWSAIAVCGRGDILIVWKRDRLCRSVYLSEVIGKEVTKQGATIKAVSGDIAGEGPEVEMVRQILASFHEFERKVISARTKHAMLYHQKNGKRMSRYCPYGTKADPEDESRLVPVDHEQKMIEIIVGMSKTLGKYAVATKLNKNPSYKMMARHGTWKGKIRGKILDRKKLA